MARSALNYVWTQKATHKSALNNNNNLLLIVRLLHLEMLTGALQYRRKKKLQYREKLNIP